MSKFAGSNPLPNAVIQDLGGVRFTAPETGWYFKGARRCREMTYVYVRVSAWTVARLIRDHRCDFGWELETEGHDCPDSIRALDGCWDNLNTAKAEIRRAVRC